MIIYNVTVNVNLPIVEEWLNWMLKSHIPDVMATGMFVDFNIYRLIGDEDSGGVTYAIQYKATTMDNYLKYKQEFAPRLQKEVIEKYGDQFTAFRSLLEVIK